MLPVDEGYLRPFISTFRKTFILKIEEIASIAIKKFPNFMVTNEPHIGLQSVI